MRKMWLLMILLLGGCNNITGEQAFKQAMSDFENLLKTEQWSQIKAEATDIQALYEAEKWKLQLLGDEDEYESLQEAIAHLQTAVRSEEQSEVEKELSTIRTYLAQIYNL